MSSLRKDVESALSLCDTDHSNAISELFQNRVQPFQELETEPLQRAYIKQMFNYVEYQQIPLGKKLVRKKKGTKMQICEKEECFIYIPLLESLKQLLSNNRIKSLILKEPVTCPDGVYYDICDGSLFKNDSYFKEHKHALILELYHDELEVCNPLGSHAGTHKIDMYYYTLVNIPPKFRSKHCAVRLLAIANAKLVNKYGIDKILNPIINDMHDLYKGVVLELGSGVTEIFGKVLICTGDTLGQHLWGGFKEGVGVAFQKCRTCYCNFEHMQTAHNEDLFNLRTKSSYDAECDEIEQALNDNVKNNLSTTYGINTRSILCNLPDFDVTKQLPQDVMHTILEGVLQYEVRFILLYYIQNGHITLKQINSAINNHNYGYTEISDKPGPLRETVFGGVENYKLKYKAAQARLFLRLLPFYIAHLIDTDEEHYLFLIQLIQIVQIIFSPVIKLNTIQHLKQLISEHLMQFKHLFPDKNIVPKQHYLVHVPSMIKSVGPLIRCSCFSFEAAHSYFKSLAQKQNFKNITLSLAKRHQLLECVNFGNENENPNSHPLFSTERNYGVMRNVTDEMITWFRDMLNRFSLLPGIMLKYVYKVSWIILHGTKYCKQGVIAVSVAGDPVLPVFGAIKEIFLVGDFIYFHVGLYRTICFEHIYQAYLIERMPEEEFLCSYERLVDYNVFHEKKDDLDNTYVSVKYDIDDLIEEHSKDFNPL